MPSKTLATRIFSSASEIVAKSDIHDRIAEHRHSARRDRLDKLSFARPKRTRRVLKSDQP